jgi:hypothetical protein
LFLSLSELDKNFAKHANKLEENNWQPYYNYRMSLMDDYHPASHTTTTTNNATAIAATTNTTSANTILYNNNQTSSAAATTTTDLNSTTMAGSASMLTNGVAKRGRRASSQQSDSSINVSGVARINDSATRTSAKTNSRQLAGVTINEEAEEDEAANSEIENIQNNQEMVNGNADNDFNGHTEATVNGLDGLRLGNNIRSTRSGKLANGGGTASAVAQAAMAKNSPNKRSRSPLVTNNNNNTMNGPDESIMADANCVLSSTRIEPHRLSRGGQMATAAAAVVAATNKARYANMQKLGNMSEIEQQAGGGNEVNETDMSIESPAKRKRKSEENSGFNEIENNGNGGPANSTRISSRF